MPDAAPPLGLLDGAALFLDFDGTLVELADTPDAIRVNNGLPSLLRRLLTRLDGRLAIVSGRALADLESHLECSGIAASGSHGGEIRLADGTLLPLEVSQEIHGVRSEAAAFAAQHGLIFEEKPTGLALHYRLSPDLGEKALALMSDLSQRSGLSLQLGKMVVELRPPGADKGAALTALMREPPFAGARPVFVGDDLTDEHAFQAAMAMGGAGVLVGAPRATAARWRLAGVPATIAWLEAAAADA